MIVQTSRHQTRENASFFVSLLWMPGWTAVGSDAKLSQHGHTASFKEESLLTCLLSVILPQTGKVRAAVAGPAINTSNRTTFSLVIKGSKEGTMQGAGIMLGVTTAGKFNDLFGGVSWGNVDRIYILNAQLPFLQEVAAAPLPGKQLAQIFVWEMVLIVDVQCIMSGAVVSHARWTGSV